MAKITTLEEAVSALEKLVTSNLKEGSNGHSKSSTALDDFFSEYFIGRSKSIIESFEMDDDMDETDDLVFDDDDELGAGRQELHDDGDFDPEEAERQIDLEMTEDEEMLSRDDIAGIEDAVTEFEDDDMDDEFLSSLEDDDEYEGDDLDLEDDELDLDDDEDMDSGEDSDSDELDDEDELELQDEDDMDDDMDSDEDDMDDDDFDFEDKD